jgi:hypothetical protein
MHMHTLCVLLAAVGTALAQQQQDEYSPFLDSVQYARGQPLLLHKRQNCPAGYNNCGSLGGDADAACCPTNSNCALDEAGHVACCPFNAVCTGTIDGTITGTAKPTTGFVFGSTTTTDSFQTATGVQGGGSTVPNIYYPFIYIPTSYANAALCSSAWTTCQSQSTACLASVAGVNGVTVSGVAGGITVTGSSGLVLSSASSICSTLSTSACYNLQVQNCAQFGSNGVSPNAGGPKATPCPGMVYAMGAGAVVGAAGVMMQ